MEPEEEEEPTAEHYRKRAAKNSGDCQVYGQPGVRRPSGERCTRIRGHGRPARNGGVGEAGNLAQLLEWHPVHPLADDDFRMFSVAAIAPEGAGPAFPANLIAGTPCRRYLDRSAGSPSGIALTGLPWLATG